jgi:hypothetical protein
MKPQMAADRRRKTATTTATAWTRISGLNNKTHGYGNDNGNCRSFVHGSAVRGLGRTVTHLQWPLTKHSQLPYPCRFAFSNPRSSALNAVAVAVSAAFCGYLRFLDPRALRLTSQMQSIK